MIFTSRTYRVAIRRSIQAERNLRYIRDTLDTLTNSPSPMRRKLSAQIRTQNNHTRRLQARKRKERK